jgi:hypothetical protein
MAAKLFHWSVVLVLIGWAVTSVAVLWRARLKGPPLGLGNPSVFSRAELLDRFDRRFRAYESLLSRLEHILALQVALVALTLYVASRGRAIETVNVLNVAVSIDLLCFLIPIGLLYSWARFGFVLSTLIDSRRALWMILDELKDPGEPGVALTLRSAIRDVGIVDSMITMFYPREIDFVRSRMFNAFRYINLSCYIVFMAAANTALIGTFLIGSLRSTSAAAQVIWLSFMTLAAVWLTATHFQFAVIHPSKYMHCTVLALAGIGAVGVYIYMLSP